MRIIGIDPGLRFTGFACVNVIDPQRGSEAPGVGLELVDAGVIRLRPGDSVARRLVELDDDLAPLLHRLAPSRAAVEKLYAHYKHPATAAIMGHARGVMLLAIARAGIDLVELGATEVKKSLTGHGHASKQQIQRAVAAQLGLASLPEPPDVADAIAIALCAARRLGREEPVGS
ncbi:MAG: crossover junction endodeoxyribonuclease RuvC [Phycisphaerales bacterium]